jgi:hypothetical protein
MDRASPHPSEFPLREAGRVHPAPTLATIDDSGVECIPRSMAPAKLGNVIIASSMDPDLRRDDGGAVG